MKGISTKAVHAYYKPNKEDGAIIPPMHLTTTFKFGNEGGFHEADTDKSVWKEFNKFKFQNDYSHYDYSRTANPTRILLEQTLAVLDGNSFGLAYSSGSAALANVIALLGRDESVLFSTDAYGGTYRYIIRVAGAQGVRYGITDLTDLEGTEMVLKKGGVKLIWVESPTNPLLKVTDIARLASLAHKYGAFLIVDNTFATPVIQKPAELGADIVAYSTTKYMNGHSDVVGGALTTSNKSLYAKLKFLQNSIGAILSPFDSWLTLRGLRTLELRMIRHNENAQNLAIYLKDRPEVHKVFYPGLFTGTQGNIVTRQMKGYGGMVSVEMHKRFDMVGFLSHLKYFPLAESLGGVESLIDHPASMTHASIPATERKKIGLSDELIRISVGIENWDDLREDLDGAFKAVNS